MKFLNSLLLLTPALALPAPQEADPSSATPSTTEEPPSSATPSASQESGSSSDLPTCSDEIKEFDGWDLTSFTLSSTTSRNAPILGTRKMVSTLSFKVENSILGYTVDCQAEAEIGGSGGNGTSSAGEFDGQYEFRCDAPEDAVQDGDVVFSFDEESGRVHMKQRWTCYDDPEYPTYYTGTGEGTADLDCETGDDQVNENWKAGSNDEYSSTQKNCKETEVAVELTQMDAIA